MHASIKVDVSSPALHGSLSCCSVLRLLCVELPKTGIISISILLLALQGGEKLLPTYGDTSDFHTERVSLVIPH